MVNRQDDPEFSPVQNDTVVQVDIGKMYAFKAEDMIPDITATHYSNMAYIVCTHRDVYIDFLEMPGIKKDGKVMVNGARVFMGHAAAQRLAAALKETLDRVYTERGMEMYSPDRLKEVTPPATRKQKKK